MSISILLFDYSLQHEENLQYNLYVICNLMDKYLFKATIKKGSMNVLNLIQLLNPNLSGLFKGSFCSEEGGGGLKLPPLSKTRQNYARNLKFGTCKYTHICICRKYTFYFHDPLILMISAFFCKKSEFFVKNSTFTQSNSMKAVLEIF